MHGTENFYSPSRFNVRNALWPEENQTAMIQGHASSLELDRTGNSAFVPIFSTGEQSEMSGFTSVNTLPSGSAAFRVSADFPGPISQITAGRPAAFMGSSDFAGNTLHFQHQDPPYHPNFNQHQFSSSEAQTTRQDNSLISHYRSSSSTPFQQVLNFDAASSPRVQNYYPYST